MIFDNDLLSIQQARILAENAAAAQKKLASFTQDKLDEIVERVADAVLPHAHALAMMSCEETDAGKWQDKLIKNNFVCTKVREELRALRCVGVVGKDAQKRTIDIGVPVGVIVALCPVTSPVSTTICKTLLAIKSGNSILFSPHPGAMKSISRVLDIMISAAQACGLPEGSLGYLKTVTKSGTQELMKHPATSLIMLTGVSGLIPLAASSGKAVIYGGTGNGPAFIERSANIEQAVKDIISSKIFDNGIAPSAEQSIVVDACVAPEVRQALRRHGAYFMSEDESLRLASLFFCADGRRKKGVLGLTAKTLAQRAGFVVPEDTLVLVAERKYVSDSDPYSRELLCPVLAYYVEDDWMHACEKCIELLLHEKKAHTLVIHSGNEEVIHQFAIKKPVGRMLVNTPASFGGMGFNTGLFPSMILGCGSAGYGVVSGNVSPCDLVYTRKVGYGVCSSSDVATRFCTPVGGHGVCSPACQPENSSQKVQLLQRILAEAIEVIGRSPDQRQQY